MIYLYGRVWDLYRPSNLIFFSDSKSGEKSVTMEMSAITNGNLLESCCELPFI